MKHSKLTTTRFRKDLDKVTIDFFKLHYKDGIEAYKTFNIQLGALIGTEEGKRQVLLQIMNHCMDMAIWAERNNLVYKRKTKSKKTKEPERSYI